MSGRNLSRNVPYFPPIFFAFLPCPSLTHENRPADDKIRLAAFPANGDTV